MPVIVEPYNPEWPSQFVQIKTKLQHMLDGVEHVSIEHVGSTSVPGLAAKPILDTDIVVTRDQLQPVISALQRSGLLYMGELGIPDRHAFRSPLQSPATNLYVRIQDSPALRNHLAVRDLLRKDGELRREYGKLKLSLGRAGLEIHEYMAKKNVMVVELLELSGGVTKEELEAIVKANTSAQRVKPVRTERLLLREFVIGDVRGLYEVESNGSKPRKMEEVQNTVVEIIQDAGKVPREHIELAVLSHQPPYEVDNRLIGRICAKIALSPTIEPKEPALSLQSQEKPIFALHYFFPPEFELEGVGKEAMVAFIPLLLAFVKEKSAGIKLQLQCNSQDTKSCKLAEGLGFERVKETEEGQKLLYCKDSYS